MGGFVGGGSRAENEPVLDLNRSERERDRDLIVLRERGQRRSLPGARVCQQRLFLHALGGGTRESRANGTIYQCLAVFHRRRTDKKKRE